MFSPDLFEARLIPICLALQSGEIAGELFVERILRERAQLRGAFSPLRSNQAQLHRTPKRVSAHAGYDHIARLAKAGLDEMGRALGRPLLHGASATRPMRFSPVILPLLR